MPHRDHGEHLEHGPKPSPQPSGMGQLDLYKIAHPQSLGAVMHRKQARVPLDTAEGSLAPRFAVSPGEEGPTRLELLLTQSLQSRPASDRRGAKEKTPTTRGLLNLRPGNLGGAQSADLGVV